MTPSDEPGDNTSFTVLDWIGVAVALTCVAGLLVFSLVFAPALMAMYESFDATLPLLTRWALRRWVPPSLSTLPLAATLLGAFGPWSLGHRRALVVGGFLMAWLILALCGISAYSPIFEMAGAISG